MMIVLRPDVIPTYYSYWFRGHHHTYCTTPQTDFPKRFIETDSFWLSFWFSVRTIRYGRCAMLYHQASTIKQPICEYVLHRAGKVRQHQRDSIGRALRKCIGGNVVADICGRLVQINLSIVYSINCVWPHHILCEEYYGKKVNAADKRFVDSMQNNSKQQHQTIHRADRSIHEQGGFVVICGRIFVFNIAICNR